MKKRFDYGLAIIYAILIALTAVCVYPFLNTIALALNDGIDTSRGGITLLPRVWTLDNFRVVLSQERLATAFIVTVARTVVGTMLNVLCTTILAFGISKPHLKFRKFYLGFMLVTMYFQGLLIPQYLLYSAIGLLNSFAVYIVPYLVNVLYMIMVMTYFRGIPKEIEESAAIDGSSNVRTLFSIVLPISMPIIAVISLYNAVWMWNQWFDAYIFVTDRKLWPMQNILVEIINSNSSDAMGLEAESAGNLLGERTRLTQRSVTAATMSVTIGPIVLFYPLIQRFFVKGVMIGSVKG